MISNHITTTDIKFFGESKPFGYMIKDNFLKSDYALKIQEEILALSPDLWDRYENPFENKYTYHDKFNLPTLTNQLFRELESLDLKSLSETPLYNDPSRHFWGIHKFKSGDHLDLHLDAGIHPHTNLKKKITLGIYLTSTTWKEENGGQLELWEGDEKCVSSCATKVSPRFNRMILFDNTDHSWHGTPDPVHCDEDQFRIFLTMSYMTDLDPFTKHTKRRAYFVPRPQVIWSEEKLRVRDLRSDPIHYFKAYQTLLRQHEYLETIK